MSFPFADSPLFEMARRGRLVPGDLTQGEDLIPLEAEPVPGQPEQIQFMNGLVSG